MREDRVGAQSKKDRRGAQIAYSILQRHLHLVSASRRRLCPKPPETLGIPERACGA